MSGTLITMAVIDLIVAVVFFGWGYALSSMEYTPKKHEHKLFLLAVFVVIAINVLIINYMPGW